MPIFESVLVLLTCSILVSAIAGKIKIPYPALLALGGVGVALSPVAIPIDIDPNLVLALFVAPVLLDAAYDLSSHDLQAYWVVIICLVFFAVGLTTLSVAVVTHLLIPGLSWGAVIALGAIVAPPDAAAATAVLRYLDAPRRITVALEGESLLNDASSLLIYRFAVAAVIAGGNFHLSAVAPAFLLSVLGSVVVGPLLAIANIWLIRRIDDIQSAIIIQFVSSFGVWLLADKLGMSSVLAVVCYALTLGRYSPTRIPARLRRPSQAVWKTAVLALNALAFVFIGMELRPIVAAAPAKELMDWTRFAGCILATVIVARIGWAMSYNTLARTRLARLLMPVGSTATWQGGLIISWCGMRGIVTLAGALALPEAFPNRSLLVFTAFFVTLGTLVIQGLTLRPLLLFLDAHDDIPPGAELGNAKAELAVAALAAVNSASGTDAEALRGVLLAQRDEAVLAAGHTGQPADAALTLRILALEQQRLRLVELRRQRAIGDHVFHQLEEQLDHLELTLPPRPTGARFPTSPDDS